MKLHFERAWSVPPSVAWPYLTIAARMNLWSEAEVIAQGDGALESAVGSHRHVLLRAFGLSLRLHETVVAVTAPHLFCYQVTPGGLLRSHRGVMSLQPAAAGTRFSWDVEFAAAVPGLSRLMAMRLRPSLERSLDALDAILAQQAA